MSTVAEIQAALPSLSQEELAQVESAVRQIQAQHVQDVRFDGQPWPATPEAIAALLAELDALPPLLTPEAAQRLDAWLVAEHERQKALSQDDGRVRDLFV